MPVIPVNQLASSTKQSGKSSGIIPIDQLPESDVSTVEDQGLGSQQAETSGAISGLPAVGVEAIRGLREGAGHMIADAGFVANAGGLAENPIGAGIQKFGQGVVSKAEAMPQTDLPGIVKGAANIAGNAAPILATFGAGEAAGVARLGEVAAEGIATMWNTPRLAAATKIFTKAMGQATLFGTMNAIDTAAMMPEHTEFRDKVNQIMAAGKSGFIAGAVLTPLLDKGLEVFKAHGEKALKAYMVGITGSEKAAQQAMDLTRTPGTYQAVMKVDPTKPVGQRIELQTISAKDAGKDVVEAQHEAMVRQQQLEIQATKDAHDTMKQKLSDDIRTSQHQFASQERQINAEVDSQIADIKTAKEIQLDKDYGKSIKTISDNLDAGNTGNSQNLQKSTQAFEGTVKASTDLIGKQLDSTYNSVINNAPGDGFSAQGIISKVKDMLSRDYGVTLTKEAQIPAELAANPAIVAQIGDQFPKKWSATSRSLTGSLPPEVAKMVSYLTDSFLPSIEEKISTNRGIVSLDMLRKEMQNIDGLAWADGVRKNQGFANLYSTVRPNRLVGDVEKAGSKGIFVGSKGSLAELKKAAMLDERFSTLKDLTKEYESNIAGSVESKARVFGKDIESAKLLSNLEAHLELPQKSNLRLSNAMKDYHETSNSLIEKKSAAVEALDTKLRLQKNAINDEISKLKLDKTEKRIGRVQSNQERYIEERRQALDKKRAEISDHEATLYDLKKSLHEEKFNRDNALNEIKTVGRGDVPLGRIQRGMITTAGYSTMFGGAHGIPAISGAILLSPKVGIQVGRGIIRASESASGQAIGRSISAITTSPTAQRVLIANLLRSKKKN